MTSETTRINATIDGQPITALVNFKDGQFHSLQIDRNEADLQLDWFNPKGFADYLALMEAVSLVVEGKKAVNGILSKGHGLGREVYAETTNDFTPPEITLEDRVKWLEDGFSDFSERLDLLSRRVFDTE